ncbi:MAG: isocitrate lyase/phosphoenolpyruvate mutase family protein [Actinomycetota bacterium]
MSPTDASSTATFRAMHHDGLFIIPNAWDAGSARYLEWRGAAAIATTSSGFAATLGRGDQAVTLDELVAHVASITAAINVPVNVDTEYCFADDLAGIAVTIDRMAEVGAAGLSIEDYNPTRAALDPINLATERVAAAVEACARHGIMLTARAENHLYGQHDLGDTTARLAAYRNAGAEVVYAPGLRTAEQIAAVVAATDAPVNVLLGAGMPSVDELRALGVRRVSTGGSLAWSALGGLARAADLLLDEGSANYAEGGLSGAIRAEVFGA